MFDGKTFESAYRMTDELNGIGAAAIDNVIRFEIPAKMDFDAMILSNNYTEIINDLRYQNAHHPGPPGTPDNFLENYGTLTVTVWIAIVMVFCLATVIFCICSCMFYSKIRRWNRNELLRRQQENAESNNYQSKSRDDMLPNYTLVSGLPSYDAAIEQYCQTKNNRLAVPRPSVFQIFRYENEKGPPSFGGDGDGDGDDITGENDGCGDASQRILTKLPTYEEISRLTGNGNGNGMPASDCGGNDSNTNNQIITTICTSSSNCNSSSNTSTTTKPNDRFVSQLLCRLQSQISTDSSISEKSQLCDSCVKELP